MNRIILLLLSLTLIYGQACKSEKKIDTEEIVEEYTLPDGAIPINYYYDLIYLVLDFDSIKGNYLFDTGAKLLCFDSVFYSENSFNHSNFSQGVMSGAGKDTRETTIINDHIVFSLQHRTFISPGMTPIIQLKPVLGDIADGILGIRFLKDSILYINYEKEYALIYQDLDSIELSPYHKIELTQKNNSFFVPLKIKVNDSLFVEGDFLLDFGSNGNISFTTETSKKYNFDKKIGYTVPYYSSQAGIGGESTGFLFNSDSLWIGDFVFKNVKTDYSAGEFGALFEGDYMGILGNDLLERFDVILDLNNNALFLKPNANFGEPFHFPKVGFGAIDRSKTLGGWIVTGLYKESDAEKAGLKINDMIIKVNDVGVDSIDFKRRDNVLLKFDNLKLTIKDNGVIKEIEFQLEDYENSL